MSGALPLGVAPDARVDLRRDIDAAVARLVACAAVEHWPIRADHCFLRIAYDDAVGARWDSVHPRPGWRSLPLDRLAAALATLHRIERDERSALVPLDAASLAMRRAAR